MKTLLIALLAITGLNACTWVELNQQGSKVTVVQEKRLIAGCQKVGAITAKTKYALVPSSPRDAKKVANELNILARNEAAKLKANAIIASSNIIQGERTFTAYFCP